MLVDILAFPLMVCFTAIRECRRSILVGVLLGAFSMRLAVAAGSPTAFTYQGRLSEAGTSPNGLFDLRFSLFASDVGGLPLGTLTHSNVAVTGGLFTTVLDFGTNVFASLSPTLEIAVRRSNGSADFLPLIPRQWLTSTPFAIRSSLADSLGSPLPAALLPTNAARLDADQVFTGSVKFGGQVSIGSNSAGGLEVQGGVRAAAFAGNGAGLSNIVAAGLSARLAERSWRVPIPFVAVTNAGNAADPLTGAGAVPYTFRLGKFEVNNRQYAAFLNAVASDDPHALYSTNMAANVHGGILRSGSPGDYTYQVKPGMDHRPVVWVDFRDALRFCNWLHNGQPAGPQDATTTEDGAYDMNEEPVAGGPPTHKPGARYWLPTGDEWYKAAFHHPALAGGDFTDFWQFPTRSNDVPLSTPPPGEANSVNTCCDSGQQSTDVGAYRQAYTYYGTYDQGGNVQEWTEEIIFVTNRRLRGGSWVYNETYTGSEDLEFDTADYDAEAIGFRVAALADP
jgi:formylglycine-generating enzyme required for sulfatase activity